MYIFNSKNADGQSLVPVINLLLGDNVVGAEVGISSALTTCTLVQNCPNIKKMYAIDSWEPYNDYIKEPYTDTPGLVLDKKTIEFKKLTALHNIKYSGVSERIKVMEMDSNDAAKEIQDNELDFVFLDAHLTLDQLQNDLHLWYGKVKLGGLIAVHDTHVQIVNHIVHTFLLDKKVSKISTFCDTIMWIK